MKSLNEDLKTGQFKQVYLLYGEESYLKKQYKDRLSKAMLPEGDTMNYAYYEGKGTDVKQVIDLAETLPFFAPRRLIVMEDTGFFKVPLRSFLSISAVCRRRRAFFCRERGGQAWQALQSSERKRPDCGNDKAGRRYPAEMGAFYDPEGRKADHAVRGPVLSHQGR